MKKIYKVFSILAFSCSRKNDSSNGMQNPTTPSNNFIFDKDESQYKSTKIEINEIEKAIKNYRLFLFKGVATYR